jgi:hypothetical protein
VSLFFGRWRFLTNGDDNFVGFAVVIFGTLVIGLVANGLFSLVVCSVLWPSSSMTDGVLVLVLSPDLPLYSSLTPSNSPINNGWVDAVFCYILE